MKLSSIRLLVNDFKKCFEFYSEKLGLKVTWGDINDVYASFDIGLPTGLSIFQSDLMIQAVNLLEKPITEKIGNKCVIEIQVESVDKTYHELKDRGVKFINSPMNMVEWHIRVVHLLDPENNLIEFFSELIEE